MKEQLKKDWDIVIHAAAVSDYRLKNEFPVKLKSGLKGLQLELSPTKKIIRFIKKWNPSVFLVGFKLETEITMDSLARKLRLRPRNFLSSRIGNYIISYTASNLKDLFVKSSCDLVVANSICGEKYQGFIVNNKNEVIAEADSRKGIANKLFKGIVL